MTSPWLPIDSAPKDGTEFLAYDPVSKKQDVCEMKFIGKAWRVWATQVDGEMGPSEDEFQGHRATHWMPLPTPPKEGE